ncbi:NAD-dependent epimerase/dehydratase family protein [Sphingomonas sp. BT-65]|uniref:NAD-dependent epimerase/dehydratase family protein n=1 Tax=Sphingomonas sp. BT-65 TaxID=2989821 RepID=UPI002236B3F3|nr:NAD-dependent epimerase/dehydratase family protein [Sphingomonas sp. BT-65]MCW4461921.1 NAD-dependent epimerase/dehydratase family protein [Sphingomonas sp. BT-65]
MAHPAPILVTGAAGFVGQAVASRLLARGEQVIGLDNFNAYYDVALKEARVAQVAADPRFTMVRGDVADAGLVAGLVAEHGIRRIAHLAAQAGVRYSIDHPLTYGHANLQGHLSVLEAARHAPGGCAHLVYASSSSVYGDRPLTGQGFREDDPCVAPVSLYAATKRSCELMSQSYATLYGLPQSGLRFFTVYGPWGRPDMAYFGFTRKILAGETIDVFGEGRMARDFTFIDDIVDGVVGVLDRPPQAGGHRLLNIGDNQPVGLMEMIAALEAELGVRAARRMLPMQPGDVTATFADISAIQQLTGYRPQVRLAEGLKRFVLWYRDYHGIAAPAAVA